MVGGLTGQNRAKFCTSETENSRSRHESLAKLAKNWFAPSPQFANTIQLAKHHKSAFWNNIFSVMCILVPMSGSCTPSLRHTESKYRIFGCRKRTLSEVRLLRRLTNRRPTEILAYAHNNQTNVVRSVHPFLGAQHDWEKWSKVGLWLGLAKKTWTTKTISSLLSLFLAQEREYRAPCESASWGTTVVEPYFRKQSGKGKRGNVK